MRVALAAVAAMCAASALAAEVTVMRPKRSIVTEDWVYYVVIGGKPITDLRPGERVTLQVAPDTSTLVIHCPKVGSGYEESRIDYDFRTNARAFFALSTTRDCVNIQALDAGKAAPFMRETVVRANRRMEYDEGAVSKAAAVAAPAVAAAPGVAAAAPAAGDAAARDQVAAATAAWADAFNSQDAGRIVGLYDSEAVLSDAGESRPRTGTAAIAAYYQGAAKRPTRQVALGERSIRVFGDTAIDSGTLTFFEMRDGKATTTPARYSLTYRNRGGKWLIVDHQSSPAPR